MFRPLVVSIGLRYTRSKRSNAYISFMSLSSMIGIALGVAVLITVLSVMNGFDEQIHKRYFGMAPQVLVTGYQASVQQWPALQEELLRQPGVVTAAPYINTQALASANNINQPMALSAIRPADELRMSELGQKMLSGKLTDLAPGQFNIILGQELAQHLGVLVGDKVTIMVAQANVTVMGMQPRFKRFTVSGIFNAGTGFGFDDRLGFVALEDAQKLLQFGNGVSGIRLKIADIYQAPQITRQLSQQFAENYVVNDWTQMYGAFFTAVKMEKTMMFLILVLIIAVAAFNLVSSLVMVVNDKQADIAILRTLGATPRMILAIFFVQGSIVGLIGTLLGTIGGIILAINATRIVSFLEHTLHVQWMSSNVYFIDFLPSKLQFMDIVHVVIVALLMSFAATLFPAWQASRTQPAEALRYE